MRRWDVHDVPPHVSRRLTERYERQARILLSVLTETPAEARNEVVAPPTMGEGAVALGPVALPAVDANAHAAVSDAVSAAPDAHAFAASDAVSAASNAHSTDASATPGATGSSAVRFTTLDLAAALGIAPPTPGLPRVPPASNAARASSESRARAVNEQRAARQLPPNPGEAFMEPPAPKGRTARLVEETSTWSRVWRPFLYESIAWFIGAFLILSGTLYFVFESWAGMTSVTRSLTVFLMTVGYSVGFSAWGGVLARRESLRKPGHILGLIGSAVAPLGGVALGPMGFGESLQLDGVHPALLVPLLFVWAGAAAWLARKPSESFDAPSRPFIQLGLVGATLIMGLAPLAARMGAPAVWLNALPCVLFFLLSSKATTTLRKGDALAFALAAPLYLTALFAIRLHLALASAGTPVPPGTYAPFVAFLLATCLRFRTLEESRAADPLAVGTVALQVACLAGAITGTNPSLFLTAAIFTGTLVSLSRGAVNRLPWLYPAYAGAYFTYASSVQLVPHAITVLLNAIKARLGYPPAEVLPFQYGALTAIPFVLAGLVLAYRAQQRGERTGDARSLGLADVLLRATTWAAPVFAIYGHLGTDSRPAFFAALALAGMSLGAGLLFKRFPLTAVGSVLLAVLPFDAIRIFGAGPAAVVAGVLPGLAASLAPRWRAHAALPLRRGRRHRDVRVRHRARHPAHHRARRGHDAGLRGRAGGRVPAARRALPRLRRVPRGRHPAEARLGPLHAGAARDDGGRLAGARAPGRARRPAQAAGRAGPPVRGARRDVGPGRPGLHGPRAPHRRRDRGGDLPRLPRRAAVRGRARGLRAPAGRASGLHGVGPVAGAVAGAARRRLARGVPRRRAQGQEREHHHRGHPRAHPAAGAGGPGPLQPAVPVPAGRGAGGALHRPHAARDGGHAAGHH
ncbi:hypothetical protein ACLEQD_06870 [Corallococcus sp. 4LFB]